MKGALAGLVRTAWRGLLHVLRDIALILVTLVIWIEEFGWRPLAAFAARFDTWPPLARLEGRIRRVRPRVALGLFLVPAVALFPLKLAALWLMSEGHGALGVALIVCAKLFGTALVGRLFLLTEPQLMQFPWLARAMGWWAETKVRVMAALRASPGWRAVRRTGRRMKARLRAWRLRWRRLRS